MLKKAKKNVSVAQSINPAKIFVQRISIIVLILASLVLVGIGRSDIKAMENIRAKILDFITPFLYAVTSPVQTYQTLSESVRDFFSVYQQNIILKNENEKIKRLKPLTVELQAENERLRKALNFLPPPETKFVTAKIIGDNSNAYGRYMIIKTSDASSLQTGQIVSNHEGLLGRITEVGKISARVMLLTDLNSRVPVISVQSGERAVLAGNNTDTPNLLYLPKDTKLHEGEKIVTSGDGNFFPQGIAVGIVKNVSGSSATIMPLVDWSRLDIVIITSTTLNP